MNKHVTGIPIAIGIMVAVVAMCTASAQAFDCNAWPRDWDVSFNLQNVRQWYPDKPIVITECGHRLPRANWMNPESLQAIITRAELEGITSSPHLSGFVVWHYTRHTWPADAFYSGGQTISPYGYKSRDRKRDFKALAVIEEYFKKKAESGTEKME